MTTRPLLVLGLAAVLLIPPGPATAATPVAPAPKRPVDRILHCFDIDGLLATTGWRARAYLKSKKHHLPEDPVALPVLVAATHRMELLASARTVVAKLPAKVKTAALAFCATEAGKAWRVLLGKIPGYAPYRKVRDPTGKGGPAQAIARDGRLYLIHWRSVRLSVLDSSGARILAKRAIDHPDLWRIVRRYMDWRLHEATDLTARIVLGRHRARLRRHVLAAVTIAVEAVPAGDLASIRRFLESPAGVAVTQAALGALEKAMDVAWDQMIDCDVAGHVLAGCP